MKISTFHFTFQNSAWLWLNRPQFLWLPFVNNFSWITLVFMIIFLQNLPKNVLINHGRKIRIEIVKISMSLHLHIYFSGFNISGVIYSNVEAKSFRRSIITGYLYIVCVCAIYKSIDTYRRILKILFERTEHLFYCD